MTVVNGDDGEVNKHGWDEKNMNESDQDEADGMKQDVDSKDSQSKPNAYRNERFDFTEKDEGGRDNVRRMKGDFSLHQSFRIVPNV